MSRDIGNPCPQLHMPLTRVAFCLDCEECFEIGARTCPACGSETWTPLARFLDAGMSRAPMSRLGERRQTATRAA
jgi:hypothetical protein